MNSCFSFTILYVYAKRQQKSCQKNLTTISLLFIFDNEFVGMDRKYCNTIIGSAAEGGNYFSRSAVEKKILRNLGKGAFVHFTAPRRVGKTSILKELANQEHKDLICIYEDIESDKNSTEFYKRLIGLIETAINKRVRISRKFWKYIESKKLTGVSIEGINLEHSEINHKNIFLALVDAIHEKEIKIVLFLDEFPDVINNIINNEDKKTALDVLHTLRSIRQTDKFNSSFGLVLSGSIGLTHVVRSIGRPKLINDLAVVKLDPLTDKQLSEFIDFLTEGATLIVSPKSRDHIKEKLKQLIPYYVQLIIEGGDELTDEEDRIEMTIEDIDAVYHQLTQDTDKFIDWVDRIKGYYQTTYSFMKEVLTQTAHKKGISIQEILNIATEYKVEEYEDLITQVLIKDGYLYKVESGKYAFASPLLRDWWANHYDLK